MIYDAEVRVNMWKDVAEDEVALKDRNMTHEEAMCLVSYFEGKFHGLVAARNLLAQGIGEKDDAQVFRPCKAQRYEPHKLYDNFYD